MGPLARVTRIRANRTARTRSPSPAQHIEPGWEQTPGIPKSGYFIELLARVRKNEQEQRARQKQVFRTFWNLQRTRRPRGGPLGIFSLHVSARGL